MPKTQASRVATDEAPELPRFKCPLVMRLTADMFRQQSELLQHHAAVLERISADPNNAESWMLKERTPERVETEIRQDETTTLALKGYQSMLQVQKRVDNMERLMIRNGISKKALLAGRKKEQPRTKKKAGKTTSANRSDPTTPFYWFFRDHSTRIADSMKLDVHSIQVARQVQKAWKQHNAFERRPYIVKAERVAALKNGTLNIVGDGDKTKVAAAAAAAKVVNSKASAKQSMGKPKKDYGSDASSGSSSSEGEGRLFQQPKGRHAN